MRKVSCYLTGKTITKPEQNTPVQNAIERQEQKCALLHSKVKNEPRSIDARTESFSRSGNDSRS